MRDQRRDDPFDDDLLATLEATAAEYDLARHLVPALMRLKGRGTPLRGAERYGSQGTVRLRFADGTGLLARASGRGAGLGSAAVAMLQGIPVLVSEVKDDGLGVHAVLAWGRGHRVECEVLGADQVD